jgi:mannose-6-phosphate isomerase
MKRFRQEKRSISSMDRIALLKNPVQEYGWGSRTFIHKLLGDSTPKGKPLAELWMGTHPHGPSEVLWKGQWTLLSHLIEESPERILGSGVARRFRNQLPFLFKVLAAAKPLSIQAHPNLNQASEGFQREESRGIGPSAPERNFRDRNHKPEIFCALRPSWVLKGFRNPVKIRSLVRKLGLSSLMDDISPALGGALGKNLRTSFTALLELDPSRQIRLISETVRSINKTPDSEPAFSWVIRLNRVFPNEAMVLSPLFLNLIHLKPGDAVMINPGTLHAYLGGAGVELMANSDNVIRAGLTSKTKDIGELLRILNFNQEDAKTLNAKKRDRAEWGYPSKTKEFALSVISATKHTPYLSSRIRSMEILICVAGRGCITDLHNGEALSLTRGVSLLVPASVEQYSIEGKATIYKAAVPLE